MADLRELIDAYRQAQAAWRKLDDETVGVTDGSPEWRAYEDAENAVLFFPCQTLEDVRLKDRFVLDEDSAYDSLKNCYFSDTGEDVLKGFLRCLTGEAQP